MSQKRHCVLYAGFFLKVSLQANIRNMFFDQPLVSQTPRSGCFAQTQTHTWTSRLYNWLGQEGSFSENISCFKNKYILCTKMPCKMHIIVWPKCEEDDLFGVKFLKKHRGGGRHTDTRTSQLTDWKGGRDYLLKIKSIDWKFVHYMVVGLYCINLFPTEFFCQGHHLRKTNYIRGETCW